MPQVLRLAREIDLVEEPGPSDKLPVVRRTLHECDIRAEIPRLHLHPCSRRSPDQAASLIAGIFVAGPAIHENDFLVLLHQHRLGQLIKPTAGLEDKAILLHKITDLLVGIYREHLEPANRHGTQRGIYA